MNKIIITLSLFAAASVASAAPTPLEIHQHIFKHLKMVRDHLVPAPAIQFVESFPPIAIPREKILQLAMVESFEEPVPPPPVPGEPIDPTGIASWAEDVALSTTQGVFDQLFPRGGGGSRRPVIVGGDPKNSTALSEDLTVMMRILEKAAGAKSDGPATASGIAVFSFGQPNSPRAFYLEGYGAMFVLSVKYPLLAPSRPDDPDRTNDTTNSEWEKAKEEVYGRRGALEDIKFKAAQGEEFNAQRVENLTAQMIRDLSNAKNIRHLKTDDAVTVVVLGGAPRPQVVRRGGLPPRQTRTLHSSGAASLDVTAGTSDAQSTMTLRAKKSDIDAFAKGKLAEEEFRRKVSVQVY